MVILGYFGNVPGLSKIGKEEGFLWRDMASDRGAGLSKEIRAFCKVAEPLTETQASQRVRASQVERMLKKWTKDLEYKYEYKFLHAFLHSNFCNLQQIPYRTKKIRFRRFSSSCKHFILRTPNAPALHIACFKFHTFKIFQIV